MLKVKVTQRVRYLLRLAFDLPSTLMYVGFYLSARLHIAGDDVLLFMRQTLGR